MAAKPWFADLDERNTRTSGRTETIRKIVNDTVLPKYPGVKLVCSPGPERDDEATRLPDAYWFPWEFYDENAACQGKAANLTVTLPTDRPLSNHEVADYFIKEIRRAFGR
jgi:hypothetical protein